MGTYENITVEREGAVAVLKLNRPEALNALTFDMMDEVQEAIAALNEDRSVRCLVLTGAGRGFCSGQDLRSRSTNPANLVEDVMNSYYGAFKAIRTCRVPVITAVNGVAAGGGFSFALAGDILMAAKSARFIQVFSRIALVPDLGSTLLLPQAIGRSAALKLMMTNDTLTAEEALKIGLISDCVEDDRLMDAALELAGRLAKGPTHALMMTRALVDEPEGDLLERQFRRELEVQVEMRDRPDAREGVAAFLEKRAPVFRGE
ncbi:enoyl-CoA hydratase/isomerase family protein [Sneathiella chinensis]|uniref:Crotonase n=1 Tax=Sneathiella chinensis TaxID=349750 RepID=A0ABQ5U3Q5_9PROT|nr:enoyl-CoA hydratase-related protein [Sneathiella chinensis]GLQ06358.1 crotonase [Sneathiella chinensis]